jgi:hypothetical protein
VHATVLMNLSSGVMSLGIEDVHEPTISEYDAEVCE